MRANVLTLIVAALLIGAGTAAAQSGPAPGYGSGLEYAQDYADLQVENASSEPVAYVRDHASASAAYSEVNHTAYVACWALDDQDVQNDACDAFYTPRGEAQPEQPIEPMVDPSNGTLNSTVNATETFASEVSESLNEVAQDPAQAPHAIKRILAATGAFLGGIGGALVAAVGGIVAILDDLLGLAGSVGIGIQELGLGISGGLLQAVSSTLDGLALGSEATTRGLAKVGEVLGTGFGALGGGIATATSATGDGLATAAGAVGSGIMTAIGAIGGGLAAVGDGIVSASKAVGGGIATATKTVGGAIADVAGSAWDGITGLFGGDQPDAASDPAGQLLGDGPGTDGLLDGVTDLLE
jgi:hypothetical protein